jgi:aminomethyltransferase
MDETTTPFEAGLGWTVAMEPAEREFVGRAALEAQLAAGVPRQTVGLVLDEKGVLRHGQRVVTANGDGEILSGSFSPTMGRSIALARIPAGDPGAVSVDVRGRALPVRVVRYPFVREGKVRV